MLTPEEQEINKLEFQKEVINDMLREETDIERVAALDSAFWLMVTQINRLKS